MEEFKGTPGRWIKRGDGIVAPGDIEVAVVVNFQDDDAMNSDANLIAAAPELLEELIETHSALCFTPDYIGSLRYEKNKAAINKALGK